MVDNPSTAWTRTLEVANVIGAIAIIGGIGVTVLGWWFSWPGWAMGASVMAAFLGAAMVCARYVSVHAEIPIETIGEWRQGYIGAPDAHRAAPRTASLPLAQKANGPPTLEEIERDYELKKRTPNLQEGSPKTLPAYEDANRVIVRGQAPNGCKAFQVFVVPYSNDSTIRHVAPLERVSTRMFFVQFEGAGESRIDIHRGAWLSEREVELDFPANCPPRWAIIATIEGDRIYAIRRDSDSSYVGVSPTREELSGSIYSVALNLLAGGQNNAPFNYILEILRDPKLELRLTPAFFWKSHKLLNLQTEGHGFMRCLHAIYMDIHEKRMEAFKADDTSDALAAARLDEREQEAALLADIKKWEARAARFIQQYLGGSEDEFLKLKPTIDVGFERANKHWFDLIGPPVLQKDSEIIVPAPRYWTLGDAIDSRVKKLERLKAAL